MINPTKILMTGGLALAWLGMAWGDTLSDPTRPPPAWLAAQPGAESAAVAEAGSASGLRMLVIGKSRKFAVIDGQVVRPGDAYNGSRVLAIKPDSVLIEGSDGPKSLKLIPEIGKAGMPQPAFAKQMVFEESK